MYNFIQIPGGELAAFRLTIIAVVISLLALVGSEVFSRKLYRRLRGSDA